MNKLDDIFLYIIGAALLLALIFIFVFARRKTHKSIDVSVLNEVFDQTNVTSLDFVRNKIVMTFKDINQVHFEDLKRYGAQGVSIVGNKIKFYVSAKKEENEKAYQALKQYIER